MMSIRHCQTKSLVTPASSRYRVSMSRNANPFRYFNSSPEVSRLVVMMYVKYPLSLRNVEDLLAERGIDICHLWTPLRAQAEKLSWR